MQGGGGWDTKPSLQRQGSVVSGHPLGFATVRTSSALGSSSPSSNVAIPHLSSVFSMGDTICPTSSSAGGSVATRTSGRVIQGVPDGAAGHGSPLASGAQHADAGQTGRQPVKHELSLQRTSVQLAVPTPQHTVVLHVARAGAGAVTISGKCNMQLSDSSPLSYPWGAGGLSDKRGAQLSIES